MGCCCHFRYAYGVPIQNGSLRPVICNTIAHINGHVTTIKGESGRSEFLYLRKHRGEIRSIFLKGTYVFVDEVPLHSGSS